MSTYGISSGGFSQMEALLASADQFTTDFKQLGSDLTSGNLAAAQQDFVTLSQDALNSPFASASASGSSPSQTTVSTASTTTSPTATASTSTASSQAGGMQSGAHSTGLSALAQDFQALSQALQSGNLSGAQQAFTQLQQDAQQAEQSGGGHHRHHHRSAYGAGDGGSELLSLLGSAGSTSNSVTGNGSSSAASAGSTSGSTAAGVSTPSGAASSGGTSSSAGSMSQIATDFQGLGEALQSGNLSGAQQAFAQLTQDAQSGSATHGNHAKSSENPGVALLQALLSSRSTATATGSSGLNISA